MLSYSFYESDNRVRRYAESLSKRGDTVDVLSLRKPGTPAFETLNGVHIHRIQERTRDEKGKFTYLKRISRFMLKSCLTLLFMHAKAPYHLIHVHNVPDFEVFSAVYPKLKGAKIILDIHDILPEFYASKFSAGKDSGIYKKLLLAEKASIAFADHVIVSNHLWEKTLCARSVNGKGITTLINYPDTSIFLKTPPDKDKRRPFMMYPGTLNWHQGLDIAVKAFARIQAQAPDWDFYIYGEGPSKQDLSALISRLGLQSRVFLKGILPIEQIAPLMAAADLGIVPKRNDFFGGEAFSTKIMEFMSMGVPVIVSKTKIDQFYFSDSLVRFFTPEDVTDLASSMLTLIQNKPLRETLSQNALTFAQQNTWDQKKHIYLSLVDSLIGGIT